MRRPTDRGSESWRTLAVLCVGSFAVLMDTTIVNVAIPSLVDTLHAGLDQVLWINNAYLLVFGSLLITMSRLGDVFGQRRLFILGLAVFALCSALCGAAQNPTELIVARAFQGLGAAILVPQPLVMISATVPAERRGATLGVYNSMIGLAAVIGPTLGGVLVTYVDWRWIFYVNVPITIAGIVLAFRVLPDLRLGRRHRLDAVGVVLATLGLAGVVFGLIEGQRYAWGRVAGGPVTIPEIMIAGAVLLVAFGFWERGRRGQEPLIPAAVLRDKTIVLLCGLTATVQFALMGIMILGAVNMQSVLGYSAVVSGLTALPLSVVLAMLAPFAGRLSDRIGSRLILVGGFTVYALGVIVLMAALSVHATPFTFVLPYCLVGLGMSCLFAPLTTEALRRVRPEFTGALAGMLNTSRQLGSSIGSAVVGGVLATLLADRMRSKAAAAAGGLPSQDQSLFLRGFAGPGHSGLAVGRGQSGGATVAAGVPEPLRTQLQRLVHTIFTGSYVDAMRSTLIIPAALLLLCAAGCALLIRPQRPATPATSQPRPMKTVDT
ncbi:DHA2 family efflux MFS transporter permease subunit [Catenulispora pinisilvae]|uniref:DHA2 family efflux MFS transporter permease subunit n=1 Tax=Catenulispora pinisilvae TaxID=2705253 RepID=UPI00189284AA|nr:DHA2 family efflux MFS transporter permease subunit [Catenulispora pinisilvae]